MSLDRDELSQLAHANHPIASPFDDTHVEQLLGLLGLAGARRVLDVGCGNGAWLARLHNHHPGLRTLGVDHSVRAIDRARARQLGTTASWHALAATQFLDQEEGHFDAILCVGSSHALGGFDETLRTLRSRLNPGGIVLMGEGYWRTNPGPNACSALGAEPADLRPLAQTVAAAQALGYTPLHVGVSSEREWDDYESSWCASLESHAATPAGAADAAQLREAARAHRQAYAGYRGVLGFAALVLAAERRPDDPSQSSSA